jgi:hypothetical protein
MESRRKGKGKEVKGEEIPVLDLVADLAAVTGLVHFPRADLPYETDTGFVMPGC